MNLLKETIQNIDGDLYKDKMNKAKEHLDFLLKPKGSLGRIEDLIIQLAGITGKVIPKIDKKVCIMMCADNGVYEEGFHSYPQDITKLIAELSGDQGIVGCSVLGRFVNAQVVTVDVGIKGKINSQHVLNMKVKNGTNNITKGPAMTKEEAVQAIEAGIKVTEQLIKKGFNLIAIGEAGICNTTTSSAMLALFTGEKVERVVGMGSGLSKENFSQKVNTVKKALTVNKPDINDPIDVLAKVGGLEIAGMTGSYLAAAKHSVPVVIDGFISGVAALTAVKLAPSSKKYMFPSHYSAEQGAKILTEVLNLKPYLHLDMRLGEGTGALLAFNIFDCAVKIMEEMGTFNDINL